MNKLVSWFISKIKKREYNVDENITTSVMIMILYHKMIMLIRGLYHKMLFKKSKGLVFIGKRVSIKVHKGMCCGSGMTIEDDCFINALCKEGMIIGDNFSLGRNSIIECTGVIRELGEGIVIGNNVGIAASAFISVRGRVIIGDNTIFGPGVNLFAENHNFQDLQTPIYMQGATKQGIEIGDDCWIGANTIILDGVHIGRKVIVAAGSVVNKDVQDYSIIGGVPARVLKMRNKQKN